MANDITLQLRLKLQDEGVAGKIARAAASIAGLRKETAALAGDSHSALMKLREGMDSISRQLAAMERLAKSAFLIFQGAGVAGSIIRTAAEFESLEAAMRAVFGSAEAVGREMDSLRAMSERLGLPLETLAQKWLSFAAAARGTALEGEAAREAFVALSEAATVLGMSQDQLSGALLAVQQMISKGAVSSEELRQQLGERLYGAVQIAARSIGLTSEAFNDLLEQGMIPVERFLPVFAQQLRKEFGQSADEAANTARAAFARLENALLDLKLEFARSGFMDAILDAARQLTDAFKDAGFRQSVREFGQLIGNLTRFIVEHGDKLVVLGGMIAGARTGAAAGRLLGPKGAIVGAGIGAVAGGIGAASILPEGTASGQDERRVMDVEAAVARLKRRIEETRHAAAAGLIKPDEAARRIAEDQASIDRLLAKPAAPTPAGSDAKLGPALQWQAMVDKYRSANDKLAEEIARAREIGKALGKPAAEIEAMIARIRGARKTDAAPRLPRLVESFDAELAALRAGLKTAEDVLEAAFRARLVKEEAYWQAKGEMQRRALDLEAQDLQRQMADQQRLIDALAKSKPADANQREEIAEKLDQAKNKLAELQIKLNEIDGRRMTVDLEVKTNLDRVRQEIEDLKAGLRERIAEATGEMTPEMRRAAVEREFRDTMQRLADDAEGQALIKRAIDVEAARREMADLETAWRLALETMRNAEQSANIQREQGLLTTAEAQARIAEAHRQAAAEMDALLPKLDAVARVLGPEAAARVAAFRNELTQVGQVVDPIATSLNTTFKDAFAAMFEQIGSGAKTAKEAFTDFARSVLSSIQRILSQRLAEQLFSMMGGSGGGIGGFFSGLFKWLGFASGGYVSGPGTSTSDSIPARLSAGEYVIRAEAVRRVAYHLHRSHPGDGSLAPMSGTGASAGGLDTVRVGASEVIHLFRPLRPGQIRGEPWLARALVKLNELDQYDDAELVRKKTAAMFAGFITRLAPEDTLMGEGLPDPQGAALAGLEPGTLQILAPGEDIKFSAPADVGASYGEFMRQQLRAVAAAMGITYEMLTGDLTQVNYSSIRAGLLEFRRRCEAIQHGVIVHQLCCPVWRAWMEQAVLEGALSLPGYARRRRAYQAAKWIPQGWQWVDPLKEFNALKLAIRAGLMSRSEAISAYGYDAEDIDREIASDNRRADSLGLVFDSDPRHDQGVATIAAQANASDSER